MTIRSRVLTLIALALTAAGCASIGSPQGGPKDETPPVLLSSRPAQGAVNWKKKKIEIVFDENVQVKNASEKVVVSPPQKRPPVVSAVLKKVVVELADSLRENETYTIDFSDAIVDNNEGNPFGLFSFAFSTGDSIDSLCVSGHVLDANTLSPVKGIVVGVHSDMDDSAFIRDPFLRVAKTDEKGFFCIRGLKDIPYKVYALNDQNRDYRFDQRGEGLAFPDSAVHLWTDICVRYDTTWNADSTAIDTIIPIDYTCFKPDDLILLSFKEDYGRQYLTKSERTERNRFSIYFGFKSDTLPRIEPLLPDTIRPAEPWYVLESSPTLDSLTYWICDSAIIRLDTLMLQIDYLKTDSNDALSPVRDTLRLIAKPMKETKVMKGDKKPGRSARKRDGETADSTAAKVPPVQHFKFSSSFQSNLQIYSVPTLTWEAPVDSISGIPWHYYQKVDTLWKELPASTFEFEQDAFNPRMFRFYGDWGYESEMKIALDSGMVRSIYGLTNDAYSQEFKIAAENEYARLTLNISGLDGKKAFVELLDKNENVWRRDEVANGVADCIDLKPGECYVRLIVDDNDNFRWDTGYYGEKRQPEQVFYFNKKLTLKANWEFNENWDIWALPLDKQKPEDLKPKDSKSGNSRGSRR